MTHLVRRSMLMGLCCLFFALSAQSQDWNPWDYVTTQNTTIYTPNDTPVPAEIITEMPEALIAYWDNEAQEAFPNAILLSSSSTTYNCHGYAWYVSEGGSTVWINGPNQLLFGADGSYGMVQGEAPNEKVSYIGADHSAITTSTSEVYISKWGAEPLMEHYWLDCPYAVEASAYAYYVRWDPTGVEDGVAITSGATLITQNSSHQYGATFFDEYPYGDFLVSFSWSLLVANGEGDYVAATGTTAWNWQASLGTLPYGYDWYRDISGNVCARVKLSAYDDVGVNHIAYSNVTISGVPNNTTSGSLTHNETWGGYNTITGTVTVPASIVLRILPGSTIRFNSNSSLVVNGTLTAVGTESQPIAFNFVSPNSTQHNGLQLSSTSGSSTLSYCQVFHADRGIYENGVSVSVTNSAIDTCTNGIFLYNSAPNINSCSIHDNTNAGVYTISSSNPILEGNTIQNNYYGIYCTTNSNPKLGNGTTHGANYLTNNMNGVFCWNNSLPMLGRSSPSVDGGYNNFVNLGGNQWNVYNMTGYSIYGQNNWWGSTNQYNFRLAGTGSIIYNPYLSNSVSIPPPPLFKPDSIVPSSGTSVIPLQAKLDSIYLLAASNPGAARTACLNLINSYPDYSVSYNALNLLRETFSASDVAGPKNLYLSLFNTKAKKPLYATAGLILASIDKPNTLSWLDQVIQSYGKDNVAELALFDEFVFYYFEKQDLVNALTLSKQLDELFPSSQGSTEAHRILGDKEYYQIDVNSGREPQAQDIQTPVQYSICNTYPNPFNPTTVIRYQITEDSKTSLIIYDVLGREVATLANGMMAAGYHSATWNAQNVATGVYFARLVVTDALGKQVYAKTAKLLLMK